MTNTGSTPSFYTMLDWPATPDQQTFDQAVETIIAVEKLTSRPVPINIPQSQRPARTSPLQLPDGKTVPFDSYHELTLPEVPNPAIDPERLAHAQALHNCIQPKNLPEASARIFLEARINKHGLIAWYLQTSAEPGDSARTIELSLTRSSPGRPDKGDTITTKLSRHPSWNGLCRTLQDVKDLTLLIHGGADLPDVPSFAVGQPENQLRYPKYASADFPQGEASLLQEIFQHHGAAHCIWIPA